MPTGPQPNTEVEFQHFDNESLSTMDGEHPDDDNSLEKSPPPKKKQKKNNGNNPKKNNKKGKDMRAFDNDDHVLGALQINEYTWGLPVDSGADSGSILSAASSSLVSFFTSFFFKGSPIL